MNGIKFFVLFVLAVTVSAFTSDVRDTRMVGAETALPGEFPFMASMQWFLLGSTAHFCGGVIIGPVWILTGAFCITSRPNFGFMEVFLGRHNLAVTNEVGRALHSVIRTFVHPGFNIVFGRNDPHDVGLVRLTNAITYTDRIRPIRLPQVDSMPIGAMTMIGWGGIGLGATILRKSTVFPIQLNDCRNAMNNLEVVGNIFNDTNFCTGPMSGHLAACNGDFGGPLIQGTSSNEMLVGLLSWGATPCGTVGAPSAVNTRISHYIGWINSVTGAL